MKTWNIFWTFGQNYLSFETTQAINLAVSTSYCKGLHYNTNRRILSRLALMFYSKVMLHQASPFTGCEQNGKASFLFSALIHIYKGKLMTPVTTVSTFHIPTKM